MPKVSTEHVQRRIAELDAQYTVAQPKRPGGFTALRSALALIILAIIAVAAFFTLHRTSSDFVQLTLKQGPPAPAMLGAASTVDLNAASEVMDTLKGAALIGTLIGVSSPSPCGCHYGRTCGKPQSSRLVQSTRLHESAWAFTLPSLILDVVADSGLSVDIVTCSALREVSNSKGGVNHGYFRGDHVNNFWTIRKGGNPRSPHGGTSSLNSAESLASSVRHRDPQPGLRRRAPRLSGPRLLTSPAVLRGLAKSKKQKLNYDKSIVDLLKLLDLDSSLTARQELAKELGYSGGSSKMNVWLHKEVMRQLAANGGKVPKTWMALERHSVQATIKRLRGSRLQDRNIRAPE